MRPYIFLLILRDPQNHQEVWPKFYSLNMILGQIKRTIIVEHVLPQIYNLLALLFLGYLGIFRQRSLIRALIASDSLPYINIMLVLRFP